MAFSLCFSEAVQIENLLLNLKHRNKRKIADCDTDADSHDSRDRDAFFQRVQTFSVSFALNNLCEMLCFSCSWNVCDMKKDNSNKCFLYAVHSLYVPGIFFNFHHIITWFGKPPVLSPIQCAKYGWVNIESDMLLCKVCRAVICATLPVNFDPKVCKFMIFVIQYNGRWSF